MAKRGGGRIINIASVARELASKGVLLNVVCPGPTNTPMMASVLGEGEQAVKWKDAMVRGMPLKRMGEPEDYAGIVAFLASEDAAGGGRLIWPAAPARGAACELSRSPPRRAGERSAELLLPAKAVVRYRLAAWIRTSWSPNMAQPTCGDWITTNARALVAIAPPAHRDRLATRWSSWLRVSRREHRGRLHGPAESYRQLRDHWIDPHAFHVAASAHDRRGNRRERARRGRSGAAIVHLHARNPVDGRPDESPEAFAPFLRSIKQSSNVVVNITTGGAPYMTVEERVRPAEKWRPEIASLNMGSMNFGLFPMLKRYREFKYDWEPKVLEASHDLVFRNSFKDIRYALETLNSTGARYEFECYDTSHLYNLHYFSPRGW